MADAGDLGRRRARHHDADQRCRQHRRASGIAPISGRTSSAAPSYLAQVIDTIPKRIGEPDRTWLALAAYNVGYGHLEDARVLAQMHGKDPDSWNDVRAQLPLLAQEQWYSRVKRGYARGWEPARFVEQVRQYLAVLEWSGTGPWRARCMRRRRCRWRWHHRRLEARRFN